MEIMALDSGHWWWKQVLNSHLSEPTSLPSPLNLCCPHWMKILDSREQFQFQEFVLYNRVWKDF